MQKSTFRIQLMNCAAEESMIRMRLDEITAVRALDFDLQHHQLTVLHTGHLQEIENSIDELGLGSLLIATEDTRQEPAMEDAKDQRKLLWTVLLINLAFFVMELVTGAIAQSMSLVADSLDMLADALVYAMSLLAVGSTMTRKKNIARASGYLQLLLALAGFMEVARRVIGNKPMPDFRTMIGMSILALAANALCLYL